MVTNLVASNKQEVTPFIVCWSTGQCLSDCARIIYGTVENEVGLCMSHPLSGVFRVKFVWFSQSTVSNRLLCFSPYFTIVSNCTFLRCVLVFSCNRLPLLNCFLSLLCVWYGTSPCFLFFFQQNVVF